MIEETRSCVLPANVYAYTMKKHNTFPGEQPEMPAHTAIQGIPQHTKRERQPFKKLGKKKMSNYAIATEAAKSHLATLGLEFIFSSKILAAYLRKHSSKHNPYALGINATDEMLKSYTPTGNEILEYDFNR